MVEPVKGPAIKPLHLVPFLVTLRSAIPPERFMLFSPLHTADKTLLCILGISGPFYGLHNLDGSLHLCSLLPLRGLGSGASPPSSVLQRCQVPILTLRIIWRMAAFEVA